MKTGKMTADELLKSKAELSQAIAELIIERDRYKAELVVKIAQLKAAKKTIENTRVELVYYRINKLNITPQCRALGQQEYEEDHK